MNKLVKGSIAGAAGIALLMGGAGSLALWNDSAAITDASVTSGTLRIAATAGTWTGNPTLIVPGQSATYQSTITITSKGTNLLSRLSIDPASITGDSDLKGALVTDLVLTGVSGGTLTETGADTNVFEVVPTSATNGSVQATAQVTVTLPSTVSGVVGQNQQVNLNALAFKLDQHL